MPPARSNTAPWPAFSCRTPTLAPDLAEYFAELPAGRQLPLRSRRFLRGQSAAGRSEELPPGLREDRRFAARRPATCAPAGAARAVSRRSRRAACIPSEEDRAFAREFLGESARPVIAIHPGSGSPRKNWPLENWAALGQWLARPTPAPRLLLVGGEADARNSTRSPRPGASADVARRPRSRRCRIWPRCSRAAAFSSATTAASRISPPRSERRACCSSARPIPPSGRRPMQASQIIQAPDGDLAKPAARGGAGCDRAAAPPRA